MPYWFDGPLAAFAVRATGADAEHDRIISAGLAVQSAPGAAPRVSPWLVSPGPPVPEDAGALPGPTRRRPQREDRWPALMLEEIARSLRAHAAVGAPLVVVNAPFVLTLLDRELKWHRSVSLTDYLSCTPLCVLDPQVLDRHLDRCHSGRRTLADLCARYGVERPGAPDAAADAVAALDLARALGRRYADRLERLSPAELHSRQAVWHAAQARGLRVWFAPNSSEEPVDPAWPLRPDFPAAA